MIIAVTVAIMLVTVELTLAANERLLARQVRAGR